MKIRLEAFGGLLSGYAEVPGFQLQYWFRMDMREPKLLEDAHVQPMKRALFELSSESVAISENHPPLRVYKMVDVK